MDRVLLGLALTAFIAVPGSAQSLSDPTGIRDFRFVSPPPPGGIAPGLDGQHRQIRAGDQVFVGSFGYPSGYNDYGDYDANRSFSPDKWNDWWHERPERAFPRWVWRNQNCTEDRMWWSGAGWRCTP